MATVGKPIRCQAAVSWAPNQPMTIEEVEVAPPKAGEIRVKMIATGLCHSDIFFLEGRDDSFIYPAVLGHEGVGVVESVGTGVTSVAPGDHVVLCFQPQCKECALCKDSRTNSCLKMRITLQSTMLDGTTRITCKGKACHQLVATSSFSEYTVSPECSVIKINNRAPLKKIVPVACCIPTGYGAAVNVAKVTPGSTAAVFGLGGVGMSVVMGCKAQKAGRIIGIDVNSDKFDLAKKFGCTDCVNPKDHDKPIHEVLEEMTGGGVEFVLISVGNLEVMKQGFNSCHPAYGQLILVGLTDKGKMLSLDPWGILQGKTVKGTFGGGYKPRDDVPGLVDLYTEGKLPMDQLITHTLPLKGINEAVDLVKTGKALRAVISFD